MDAPVHEWPKNLIKAEMKRNAISTKQMIELLKPLGEDVNEFSFNNKVSRGGFSAIFFFKCMKVLKVKRLELE